MFAQCLATPDDDAPRLVWADSIGGERGELVVLQCDLARGGLAPDEVAIRRRRERELLARHGAEWAGLAGLATGWTFVRGFVEAVQVDLAAAKLDAIFAAAPLATSLAITNMAGAVDPETRRIPKPVAAAAALGLLGEVLAHPAMKRLRALEVIEPAGWVDTITHRHGISPLADDVAALLSAYGVLGELRTFGITGGGLGARGLDALGALAVDVPLVRLALRRHRVAAGNVTELLHRLPRVVELDLAGTAVPLEQLAPILERPLRSLAISGITNVGFEALAGSVAARTLERLALFDPSPGFDRAVVGFPALRELALGLPMSCARIASIAASLGSQLELLDLRATYRDLADPAVVAGDTLADDPRAGEFLVFGDDVRELPPVDQLDIGRLPRNDIVISQLLPVAATLTWQTDHHRLLDLETRRIYELADGMELRLGHLRLRYFAGIGAGDRVRALLRPQA